MEIWEGRKEEGMKIKKGRIKEREHGVVKERASKRERERSTGWVERFTIIIIIIIIINHSSDFPVVYFE